MRYVLAINSFKILASYIYVLTSGETKRGRDALCYLEGYVLPKISFGCKQIMKIRIFAERTY
jgi:hypothetical protein